MDAYMKGEDIMASNMAAGKTFFQSFMKGSDYPADSPCAAASLAYVKELAKKPSNPNAAAMVSYITEAIENKERKLDPVCAAAPLPTLMPICNTNLKTKLQKQLLLPILRLLINIRTLPRQVHVPKLLNLILKTSKLQVPAPANVIASSYYLCKLRCL